MVHGLAAKGRKLVIIIDPHIKRDFGYFLHNDATHRGFYVKNKDGNDYEGKVFYSRNCNVINLHNFL